VHDSRSLRRRLRLPARSCLIDGEVIVSDDDGLAVFELLRSFRRDHAAVLCAFDLLELDGQDLRRLPIELRKAGLMQLLLRGRHSGIALNQHYVGDGDIVYQQACKLGCEGIVSKRVDVACYRHDSQAGVQGLTE
jgi:bifunctional non-homologous end joining protein LigD